MTADLVNERRLLQQQLALVEGRFDATSMVLARKTGVLDRSSSVKMLASLPGLKGARRPQQPPGMAMMGASPLPRSAAFDRMRESALIKRTKTKMMATAAAESRPAAPKKPPARLQQVEPTHFPKFYSRGELPCSIEHRGGSNGLSWVCPLLQLDYDHYLPIFFDGLRCTEHPYAFVASRGAREMVEASRGYPDCLIPVVPSLILPLRLALRTHDPKIVLTTLELMQALVTSNFGVGEALVPFYKQLLNVVNLFLTNSNLATTCLDTLELLEKTGGDGAYTHIKRMVPSYQSVMR